MQHKRKYSGHFSLVNWNLTVDTVDTRKHYRLHLLEKSWEITDNYHCSGTGWSKADDVNSGACLPWNANPLTLWNTSFWFGLQTFSKDGFRFVLKWSMGQAQISERMFQHHLALLSFLVYYLEGSYSYLNGKFCESEQAL